MSSQNHVKKPRLMNKKKGCYQHYSSSNRKSLEVGHKGFFVTCNFRESECARESYKILNFYADKLYGVSKTEESKSGQESTEDLDITDELEKNVDNINKASKNVKQFRFIALDTGAKNCIFIKTTLPDPTELGTKLIRDIAETKISKSRHLLRLIPIEVVCKANLQDIVEAAGPLFDKHFLKGNATFAIVYNKRYNSNIKRDEIIMALADLVVQKNNTNKVNLNNPQLSIIIELVKSRCCISVLEDYIKLKKYNLAEITAANEPNLEEHVTTPGEIQRHRLSF